jgi:hypothetical protein
MKKITLLIFAALNFSTVLFCQTCPTRSAATEANEVIGGNATWTTLGNSATSDNIRDISGSLAAAGQFSDRLKLTNFGFSIPTNSSIQGITVTVERSIAGATSATYTDNDIMLVKGGITQTATDKSTATAWTTSDVTVTYGNSTDLWGNTWLPADINSSGFGFAISAIRTTSPTAPQGVSVDFVSITVCYITLTPLTIKQFAVTKTVNGTASINWTTTNEQQVKNMQVQKSTNGTDFNFYKSILQTCKNLSTDNQYRVTDNLLLNGTTYYRLKINDENGGFKYSETKSIVIDNKAEKAFINYNNEVLTIGISNKPGNYVLQVNDVTGNLLFSKIITTTNNYSNVSIPLKFNSKQLIIVSLKSNNFSIQKKYIAN